jgi:RNA polymerase sigma-70 factor (ECF subfamily)
MATSSETAAARRGRVPTPLPELELDRVYQQHFAFVWRSLLRLGVNQANIDDAAQDVFLVVHRRLDTFEGRSSLKTWLFSVAQHVALSYKRRQRRAAAQEPVPLTLTDRGSGPERATETAETAQFIDAFLDSLDDGRRAVFILVELEQMTAPEAAESLGIKVNTVYSRLRVARSAFRQAALASGRLGK